MTPIELRSNLGTGLQLLYNQRGMTLESDCTGGGLLLPRIRSTVENSFAASKWVNVAPANGTLGTPQAVTDIATRADNDTDMDTNNAIRLTDPSVLATGSFSFSGGGGTVVTGVYTSAIQVGTAQGDCVFAGVLNQDS